MTEEEPVAKKRRKDNFSSVSPGPAPICPHDARLAQLVAAYAGVLPRLVIVDLVRGGGG